VKPDVNELHPDVNTGECTLLLVMSEILLLVSFLFYFYS
jgi:hypothetical protein